jgi:hypothetical protein
MPIGKPLNRLRVKMLRHRSPPRPFSLSLACQELERIGRDWRRSFHPSESCPGPIQGRRPQDRLGITRPLLPTPPGPFSKLSIQIHPRSHVYQNSMQPQSPRPILQAPVLRSMGSIQSNVVISLAPLDEHNTPVHIRAYFNHRSASFFLAISCGGSATGFANGAGVLRMHIHVLIIHC